MKILHVNKYYSQEGGLEQYLMLLCLELEDLGHENIVVYGSCGEKPYSHERKKLYLPQIADYECPDFTTKIDKLKSLISQEDPDLIFIHQVLNTKLIAFLATSRPHIRFAHGYKLTCPEGRRVRAGRICEYPASIFCQLRAYRYRCMPRNPLLGLRLIKNCRQIAQIHKRYSHLIVASGFMKRILVLNGFNPQNITVIPYFTILPEPPQGNGDKILCVSRLTPGKGVEHLLGAFALINKPVKLIIAGEGPSMAELKEKAVVLGISHKVTFTGWLDKKEISQLYYRSSVVIVPSVWPEPFGIVGIEAMAHEKPVVAYDVGGISEWLEDDKTGYLVKRGDESGLAEKISYLLDHEQEALKLGRQGRRIVQQRFTKETHIKKLLVVIHAQS